MLPHAFIILCRQGRPYDRPSHGSATKCLQSQKHRKWEVSGHIGLSIEKIVLKLCCVYEAFSFFF